MGACASSPSTRYREQDAYNRQLRNNKLPSVHGQESSSQPAKVEHASSAQHAEPETHHEDQSADVLSSIVDEASMWSSGAAFGKVGDVWSTMQKTADYLCSVTKADCVSFTVISSTLRCAKVVCNSSSPQTAVARARELCHISEVPSALQVASSGQPSIIQLPPSYNSNASARKLPPDLELLHQEAGCKFFLCVPLFYGRQVLGTLQLACRQAISPSEQRWLAGAWPWLSMYLHEVNAVRLVNILEKIQTTSSVNSLAWVVTSELDTWFDWCHPDDTEARLVLLSEDQPTALVLSCGASSKGDAADSLYSSPNRHGGLTSARSTASGRQDEGLLATQMSLVNTLTRRCLAEGSKLLFVADVMAALKKYGEPWKDIFLDQAHVPNPVWVIAAPLMMGSKHLGAIIWLSSSRLSPTMLAQAAKTNVPPILHGVAEQLHAFMQQGMRARSGAAQWHSDELGLHTWSSIINLRHVIDSGPNLVSRLSGSSSQGGVLESFADTDFKPIRYSIARSNSASTNALMRVYQTAIAQHRRLSTSSLSDVAPAGEEIEVVAKAGQGAFGSVYVAMWKGQAVAVKVMKQQLEGRRAMRTAWELAVTKSLMHLNVVKVHAVLTDVVVEKRSKRVIRFVPTTPTPVLDPGQGPPSLSTLGGPGASSVGSGAAGAGEDGASNAQPRCQVIIMEYCNLGPLHHYISERRFVRQMAVNQAAAVPSPQGTSRPGSSGVASPLHNQSLNGGPAERVLSPSGMFIGMEEDDDEAMHGASGWMRVQQADLPVIIATLAEVAEAMEYMHSIGFIHCDLKPENILLKTAHGDSRGFVAKVSDFGLSEMSTQDGPLMGELGGTVTHIAPEVITQKKVTKCADVYSFGIIMWEVYSGQRPYMELLQSTTDKKVRDKLILTRVAHEHMRPQFPSHAPPDYASLALRCWSADWASRPSFTDIIAELHAMQTRYGMVQAGGEGTVGVGGPGSGGNGDVGPGPSPMPRPPEHAPGMAPQGWSGAGSGTGFPYGAVPSGAAAAGFPYGGGAAGGGLNPPPRVSGSGVAGFPYANANPPQDPAMRRSVNGASAPYPTTPRGAAVRAAAAAAASTGALPKRAGSGPAYFGVKGEAPPHGPVFAQPGSATDNAQAAMQLTKMQTAAQQQRPMANAVVSAPQRQQQQAGAAAAAATAAAAEGAGGAQQQVIAVGQHSPQQHQQQPAAVPPVMVGAPASSAAEGAADAGRG